MSDIIGEINSTFLSIVKANGALRRNKSLNPQEMRTIAQKRRNKMRVNIYAEEMPDNPRIEIIEKDIDGNNFTALRIYLELPATIDGKQYQGPFIHRPGDDDSSAVTFWGKRDLRKTLVAALQALDEHYYARSNGKPLTYADIPRRSYTDRYCAAEYAIARAMAAVEKMPASVHLADAVVLLSRAKDKVADFIDAVPRENPQ